nr:threonine/serine dehydratase [uncultured Sphingomonas sp.]
MHPLVSREAILIAAQRIGAHVIRTPLIETEILGRRSWLKCESLQTGGAFKLRGATNRLLQLDEDERRCGVVAFSSGNHAQGVAIAAKRLGIRAIIVMPSDAPALKIEGTRAQGADIIFYDRAAEDRVGIAHRIASELGATVVPSFDDVDIVVGQGTIGLEIEDQLGRVPDRIVMPCGGGGLAAGIAIASPDSEIHVVEPTGWDDMGRSLALGEIVPVEPDAPATMCDALQTRVVSPITFSILEKRGAAAHAVTDEQVRDAIRWVWMRHQLKVEPGGAAGLAAALAGMINLEGEPVIVLSGSNIDGPLHHSIINND